MGLYDIAENIPWNVHTVHLLLRLVLVCYQSVLSIPFTDTSLALGQSYDCDASMKNIY